jgi:hypothetical protein
MSRSAGMLAADLLNVARAASGPRSERSARLNGSPDNTDETGPNNFVRFVRMPGRGRLLSWP